MKKQLLHSGWQLTTVGKNDTIPATVPGSVYNDLLNAGRMEDPYWRDIMLCGVNGGRIISTYVKQTVTVKWELRNNRSEVLRDGGEVEITVPAMDTVWLDTVELPEANMFTDHVHYACYQNGEMISESTVLFSVPKYYDYIDPQLSCRVEGDEIIVSAKAYAKSVEVLNENEDWVLEDNYFDLEADKERRIRIVSGDANGIHMRSVYNIR